MEEEEEEVGEKWALEKEREEGSDVLKIETMSEGIGRNFTCILDKAKSSCKLAK